MPRFLVMLDGGPVELPPAPGARDQPLIVGFVTTRKVRAASQTEAIRLAIDDATTELGGTASPVAAADLRWSVEEVWVPRWFEARGRRYRGFTFYPWPGTEEHV